MEKKGNVFVALKILQLCSTETQKRKGKKKIYLQKQWSAFSLFQNDISVILQVIMI